MPQPLWFTKMLEQLSPAQDLECHQRKNVLHKQAGYGLMLAEKSGHHKKRQIVPPLRGTLT